MKVLLIGGGGREHALGWKISQSALLTKLYLTPGNPGLNDLGAVIDARTDDIKAIVNFATREKLDLVVIGPEAPLAAGLADALAAAGVACFGPTRAAAMLETSKAFSKEVCIAAGAPTARFGRFTDADAAKGYLSEMSAPYVIKADGLAAGKGVVIAATISEAEEAIDDMLSGQFGAASAEIVIEEFMEGEEASFFVLSDGETIAPMIAAQDHKRAFDGDEGPNTGGMGAYSPAPVFTAAVQERTLEEIVKPVIAEMARRGTPYQGVLYVGLMIKDGAPRVVEFNARFGDPECQVLMRLLKSDLLSALHAAATGRLRDVALEWHQKSCALVVLAARGYPGAYEKGSSINGIDAAAALPDVEIFHAGTKTVNGQLVANGGRVLNVTATGQTIKAAIDAAYAAVDKIDWPEGFCRRDIGWRAVRADKN